MHSNDVIHGHAVFRVLLQAMSRPGKVYQLPHAASEQHEGMLVGLLQCLMDNEVTYCVVADEPEALAGAVSRHTGSRQADPGTADFLIFRDGGSRGLVRDAKRGTLEYPDKGATAIYLVEKLGESGGGATLRGPGIDGVAQPVIEGLAAGELGLLREMNSEFPLGVDAVFLDRLGCITCIPRSTRIAGC
jgi:alpha-D-ribose 1-methylphosphonate 5-triphosphate synthase subunit PhnH